MYVYSIDYVFIENIFGKVLQTWTNSIMLTIRIIQVYSYNRKSKGKITSDNFLWYNIIFKIKETLTVVIDNICVCID